MARSNNVQQCPTWSCGIMWHHVASRGLLRLRFIYRRLCLSFCGSCLVFLHCHCMLLWSCDRCSYRSRQAMQLKKTKASLPTLLFGTRSFSFSLWPLCFFGRLFAFTAAFASCFWPGPYICLPTTSRMYSFLCQTHHIFAIIDHINSLSHGRSLVNSTRRTRWCSKVRWLSPTAFVFDFPRFAFTLPKFQNQSEDVWRFWSSRSSSRMWNQTDLWKNQAPLETCSKPPPVPPWGDSAPNFACSGRFRNCGKFFRIFWSFQFQFQLVSLVERIQHYSLWSSRLVSWRVTRLLVPSPSLSHVLLFDWIWFSSVCSWPLRQRKLSRKT